MFKTQTKKNQQIQKNLLHHSKLQPFQIQNLPLTQADIEWAGEIQSIHIILNKKI